MTKHRVVYSQSHCAVTFDLRRDEHVAWAAKRWISGEAQKSIAKSMGCNHTRLCLRFADFIKKYYPECAPYSDYHWGPYITAAGEERKPLLATALARWFAEVAE
jgi:hypothetical protein